MFTKIISCVIVVLLSILTWFLKKIDAASNSFFEKKAENLATKQDIAEITRKTEEVQSEFKRGFSVFEQDLEYQHQLYENQYNKVYSKLFYLICQSEGLRFVEKQLNNDLELDFKTCPIVELQSQESIMKKIIDLIDSNIEYVTPGLIRLCVVYRVVDHYKKDANNASSINHLLLEAKKEIVKKTIIDYVDLRNKLKLENNLNIGMIQGTVFETMKLN